MPLRETTLDPVGEAPPAADGRPVVRVLTGALTGLTLPLERGEYLLGKADDCDLRLPDHGVSRRHARLLRTSDLLVTVLDLRSTNGSFVGGKRVEMSLLRDGEVVQLGPVVQLRLEYVAGDPTAAAPALTERQVELVRLVAAGLSNAEIAARLQISQRTVTTHVEHVYRRLDLRSRAALALYAAQHGLVPPRRPG